jgi:hypothetical protein
MGVIQQPPPTIQVAEARYELYRFLPPAQVATLFMISKNLNEPRYAKQKEAFSLTFWEAAGMVSAAQATKSTPAIKDALGKAAALIDQKILKNPAYDPFRTTVAVGDDPILGATPRDHDGVGPGQ